MLPQDLREQFWARNMSFSSWARSEGFKLSTAWKSIHLSQKGREARRIQRALARFLATPPAGAEVLPVEARFPHEQEKP